MKAAEQIVQIERALAHLRYLCPCRSAELGQQAGVDPRAAVVLGEERAACRAALAVATTHTSIGFEALLVERLDELHRSGGCTTLVRDPADARRSLEHCNRAAVGGRGENRWCARHRPHPYTNGATR